MRGPAIAIAAVALSVVSTGCKASTTTTATVTVTSPPEKSSAPDRPRHEQAISEPTPDNTGQPAPRGLLSKESYWNNAFQVAPVSECVSQGSSRRGNSAPARAWRLPNGALACATDPTMGVWGDRLIHAVLYFEPSVAASTARATAMSLLPSDVQQVGSVEQANLEWSIYRGLGSCKHFTFESDALAAAVHGAGPDWTGPAKQADVKLYSGNVVVPDGADQLYRADSIHAATIGNDNRQ